MNEQDHAEHRPLTDHNPAEAAAQAPTSLGQLYPTGDILAIIDDRGDAERAVQALMATGISGDDIDLVDGAWFTQTAKEIKEQRSPLERVLAFLAEEEGEGTRQYLREAELGHTIVVVHAEQPEVVNEVASVLRQCGAHEIRHYGEQVITDL